MIRRFILNMLLRLYVGSNREIKKLSSEEEFRSFLFKSSYDVESVLKAYMTDCTLSYFEDKDDKERNIDKGIALGLKLMIDLHQCAVLADKEKTIDGKLKKFVFYKNNKLGEITKLKTQ